MKFKVASGRARESLWQEPGRGSGICMGREKEKNKQIVVDSTKTPFMLRLQSWDKNSINFSDSWERELFLSD